MVDVDQDGTRRGAPDDADTRPGAARGAQRRIEREAAGRSGAGRLRHPGSGLCVSEATTDEEHQQTVALMELCGAAGQQWNVPAA